MFFKCTNFFTLPRKNVWTIALLTAAWKKWTHRRLELHWFVATKLLRRITVLLCGLADFTRGSSRIFRPPQNFHFKNIIASFKICSNDVSSLWSEHSNLARLPICWKSLWRLLISEICSGTMQAPSRMLTYSWTNISYLCSIAEDWRKVRTVR